jgi:predicted O-methyltransferase YrrM
MSKELDFLDSYVSKVGNGLYYPNNYKHENSFQIPPPYGIQQSRDEINDFISIVKARCSRRINCIEIGLGHYGSTHVLFRTLFDNVVTIEKNSDRVLRFNEEVSKTFEQFSVACRHSKFIYGYSFEPSVFKKAMDLGPYDLLFIDGDHAFHSVMVDFHLYFNLLDPGGLIAFHDVNSTRQDYGVRDFLNSETIKRLIEKNMLSQIEFISHSSEMGIAFATKT